MPGKGPEPRGWEGLLQRTSGQLHGDTEVWIRKGPYRAGGGGGVPIAGLEARPLLCSFYEVETLTSASPRCSRDGKDIHLDPGKVGKDWL